MPTNQNPTPPGWYTDPKAPASGERYWTGSAWTDQVRPRTFATFTEPAAAVNGQAAAPARSWWKRKRVLIPAAVVLVAIVGGAAGGGGSTPKPTASAARVPTPTESTDVAPATTEAPTTTAPPPPAPTVPDGVKADAKEYGDLALDPAACTTEVQFGYTTVRWQGTVTNGSSKPSNYSVSARLTDTSSGVQLDTAWDYVTAVAPGATALVELTWWVKGEYPAVACQVTELDRTAAF